MKLSQVAWRTVGGAAIKEYRDDDIPGLATEMAYWIAFSIFPFLIFLAMLTGLVAGLVGGPNLYDAIERDALSALPPATADALREPARTTLATGGAALTFGALASALLALNSASSGVLTILKAFNRAYGVRETRPFLVQRLLAVGLTLVLIVLLVGGALLLVLGYRLADWLGLGGLGRPFLLAGRLVGGLALINLGLAILYWKGPNLRQQFRWISPGSALATLTLALFAVLFSVYVRLLGGSSYSKTYGAAVGLILFLLFLRWASTIILLGAEFNAETTRRYDPETIRDELTDPRKQLPGEQPVPHPQAAAEAGVTPRQVAESNVRSAQQQVADQERAAATATPGAGDGRGA